MTGYHWPSVRDQLVELFGGELPHAETEAELVEAFEQRPRTILVTAAEIAKSKSAPRSYWAVLRKRMQQAETTHDVTATDTSERERKIVNARRWIHNAGLYFDREDDVVSELFDVGGMLHEYDSASLRAEMVEAWRQERSRGERAEQEAQVDATTYRRLQWLSARARGERWANIDDDWEGYEAEREAGRRPLWRPGQASALTSWPK